MAALKQYSDIPENLDALSGQVVDAIYHVHKELGPGYLEKIYEDCLCVELSSRNIAFSRQCPLSLSYKGEDIQAEFRLDLVVDDSIIIELKAVEKLLPVHGAQLYSYLKMSKIPLGFLVNFNVPLIKDGIKRYVSKSFVTS